MTRTTLAALARDAIGLAGVGAVVHGINLISRPAAWIIGGALLIVVAVSLSRRANP